MTDIIARNGTVLAQAGGSVLATDCRVACRITLELEDQQCSETPRDVGLQLTGAIRYQEADGPPCGAANRVLRLFADADGPITVAYLWRAGRCVQRFRPKVDGIFCTWDDGEELLLVDQTKQVTLTEGQRLQLYMTNLSGCVDGEHDDHGGRAEWTLEGCRPAEEALGMSAGRSVPGSVQEADRYATLCAECPEGRSCPNVQVCCGGQVTVHLVVPCPLGRW